MKSTKYIIGGLVVIGIILVVLLIIPSKSSPDEFVEVNNDSSMMDNTNSDTLVEIERDEKVADLGNQTEDDRYIEYRDQDISSIDGKRVLYFYANWCPTCRLADPDLKKRQFEFPDGVVVIRVNYNDSDTSATEKALAKAYGITYQHIFVQIDASGNEIAKWNGGDTDELLIKIK